MERVLPWLLDHARVDTHTGSIVLETDSGASEPANVNYLDGCIRIRGNSCANQNSISSFEGPVLAAAD
jgi:hypothetical protein